jgi:hypothetical protein
MFVPASFMLPPYVTFAALNEPSVVPPAKPSPFSRTLLLAPLKPWLFQPDSCRDVVVNHHRPGRAGRRWSAVESRVRDIETPALHVVSGDHHVLVVIGVGTELRRGETERELTRPALVHEDVVRHGHAVGARNDNRVHEVIHRVLVHHQIASDDRVLHDVVRAVVTH